MSTSVKIEEEDKEKLEKLQALVTLKVGQKLTQQEILSALIREAYEKSDELVEKMLKANVPMTDQEYERILSLVEDWGAETSWEEVDQTLYGTKAEAKRLKP